MTSMDRHEPKSWLQTDHSQAVAILLMIVALTLLIVAVWRS